MDGDLGVTSPAAGCEWSVHCPPKVNLYLRIVRRREDGFHELETVFQSVDGGDLLSAEASNRISLTCTDPLLPVDETNLVTRAALRLHERFGLAADTGARLHLEKRTPMQAGMGGGSVDAAAALRILATLWDLPSDEYRLHQLAAELGSDVPFFLLGGTALARGRGEVLQPLSTPPLWLVLLKPAAAVPTPWAFRQWDASRCSGPSVEEFSRALAHGDPAEIAAMLRNDLEPGVAAGVPEIAGAREWLVRHGVLGARMTGSGSVVFGIARDEAHAREIAGVGGAPGLLWTARTLTSAEASLCPRPGSGA